ncbi:MAG: hypothetical protein K2O55_06575, partial [Alistipes sp.]|nr:hypothetical protein [Alistipes sp.]
VGGVLRIRSAEPLRLSGRELHPAAAAECPNPLLRAQAVQEPLVAPQLALCPEAGRTDYLYDVRTEPGKSYRFVRAGQKK